MFDFLRNLTKSAEEKRQETVAAYLDEALTDRARQQFEQAMAQDEALRQEVEQLRLIKQSLRQLPQREVPRNFILDPAKYGRPAPQPWVKAYPVLRAATAMTVFFLIFAFAAGIFTNLGAGEMATSAPAADVAQMEAVEVTRVVTEETETQAFELAEEEAMAEEAPAEEAAEPAAEMAAEEEMADEEVVEEVEAPAAPEATAVSPIVTDSIEEETAEDGATATEPLVAPTPTPSPLPTLSSTPTVSTLPRVTPPTPLPERDADQMQSDDTANEAVADVPETAGETESVVATAVQPEEQVQGLEGEGGPARPFNSLLVLQIGLGVLLLLLAGLTFYARRQR